MTQAQNTTSQERNAAIAQLIEEGRINASDFEHLSLTLDEMTLNPITQDTPAARWYAAYFDHSEETQKFWNDYRRQVRAYKNSARIR